MTNKFMINKEFILGSEENKSQLNDALIRSRSCIVVHMPLRLEAIQIVFRVNPNLVWKQSATPLKRVGATYRVLQKQGSNMICGVTGTLHTYKIILSPS
jgi:hypothetical protein